MSNFKKIKKTIITKKIGYRKPKNEKNSSKGEQINLTIPVEGMRDMEINKYEREVSLIYNPISKELKIKKKIK